MIGSEYNYRVKEVGNKFKKVLKPAVFALTALGLSGVVHETAKAQQLRFGASVSEQPKEHFSHDGLSVLRGQDKLKSPGEMIGSVVSKQELSAAWRVSKRSEPDEKNVASAIAGLRAAGLTSGGYAGVRARLSLPGQAGESLGSTPSRVRVDGLSNASESGASVTGKAVKGEAKFRIPYIGVELLGGPDYKELSPEFAWVAELGKKGLLKGFSFVEKRPNSVFNNNSIAYKPSVNFPVYPKVELGFAGDKPFGSFGVEWNIKDTFSIGRVFDAATVAYLHKMYGVAPEQQILFVWDTKALKIFGLDIDNQGFIRFRPGDVGKYGQPQITIGAKWLPEGLRFLFQADVAGSGTAKQTKFGFSVGVKIYPQEAKWYKSLAKRFKGNRN